MFSPSQMASVVGAALILSGIALVTYQLLFRPPPLNAIRSAKLSRTGFQVKTHYPGIVMIGIGALLLILSTLGT